jgi:hypothetical protein
MTGIARASVVAAAVAVVLAASPERARSAVIGPTVMMIYGAPLPKPVFITGSETGAFGDLHARSPVTAQQLEGRLFYSVALFWGPASDPAVNGVRNIADLRPEMAWQHGRLYPPTSNQPAVLLTTLFSKGPQRSPKPEDARLFIGGGPVPAAGLATLKRLGLAR